jgi:hypothetical protein
MPGRRSTILYWPFSSVTTERTRSISTGLPASTVTPGITAPVPSRTTPAMALDCANAIAGAAKRDATTIRPRTIVLIAPPEIALTIRPRQMRVKQTNAILTAL